MDKTAIIIIGVVVLLGAGAFFLLHKVPSAVTPATLPEGIVLFYGEECPHCKIVEDFVTQNKIEEKVKFSRVEVWHNQANALALGEVAVKCGQDVSQGVPVPFLYDGKNKCVEGDQDIINYFKNEAGVK